MLHIVGPTLSVWCVSADWHQRQAALLSLSAMCDGVSSSLSGSDLSNLLQQWTALVKQDISHSVDRVLHLQPGRWDDADMNGCAQVRFTALELCGVMSSRFERKFQMVNLPNPIRISLQWHSAH
jgi:hypothetical protein